MKKIHLILGTVVLAGSLSACSSAYFASASYASDDLYATHDRRQIALEKQAEAEARKAEAEARKAEWEALIAEAEAAASENRYYEYKADVNPYDAVLADDYESAYARRLRGFESPTYRMPSSYINARYSSEFNYVSAYDPAFYNIVISGDQIWVEPKYITSMFGTWGGTVICADPWYYGWTRPWNWGWGWSWSTWYNPWYYSSWYNPWWAWNWSWNWGWSWSWSWNWGWGPGWYGGPGWHGHPHWGAPGPARPRYSNLVRRPDPYRSPSGTHYRSGTRYMNAPSDGSPSRGNSGRRSYFGIRDNNTFYNNSGNSGSRSYRNNSNNSIWDNNRNNTGSNSFNRGNSSSFNRGSSSSSFGGSRGGGSGTRPSGGSSRNAGGR